MTDAVHLELLKHVENLKIICSQIKELQHDPKSNAPDPSCESHQRQMSMRLSQVFERLKLNETLQCVLEETFQNQHVSNSSLFENKGKRFFPFLSTVQKVQLLSKNFLAVNKYC